MKGSQTIYIIMPVEKKESLYLNIPFVNYSNIKPGTIIKFQYLFAKHDPVPLLLISRIYADKKVAGINLNYLTFPITRQLISDYANKASFSYQSVKGNRNVIGSYRCYKNNGIKLAKIVNSKVLMTIYGTVRTMNPNEVELIRKEIQKQLREYTKKGGIFNA